MFATFLCYIEIIGLLVGFIYFLLKYFFPGRMCYISKDMTGKFVIITGASSGLGEFTAIELVKKGAKVIFACRNKERAEKSIQKLPKELQDKAIYENLDLCDLENIQAFTNKIIEHYPKIDVLINNAGAQPTEYIETKDGLESFLEGNHLGPMTLTLLLLEHFEKDSRIINVSSCAHYYSSLNENSIEMLSNLQSIKEYYYKNPINHFTLYFDTKIMNLYFTQYLAEECIKHYPHIKVAALHPGGVNTNVFRYLNGHKIARKIFEILAPIFLKNTKQGAQTHLYLSYLPFEKIHSGGYYVDCQHSFISKKAQNKKIRDIIIKWSINQILNKASCFPEFVHDTK